ncbi:hypothetical protein [Mycobacterium branderi]|uniref:Secreted protein n=1 Tax=Mycobacterium branderi TaxID=43348 RepID=A0A7I7WDY7_9MYCO|nr:hypothetical protein [Mycobacterium branderi]MCV7236263.1 hypothetical protein [Mycobacterium branderi]ORA35441.1 hypothetical protein BST20_17760 [Mycobacterium branderi]BBZ15142.1 hypothetical protein MBRA_53370 [Mycobacterium branderi]
MLNRTPIAIIANTFAVAWLGVGLAASGVASAAPPGFPDLGAFQPVDPARYTAAPRAGGAAYFVTPDGIQCIMPTPYKPGDHVSAGCSGPLPGLPPDAPVGSDGCSAVGSPTSLPTDLGPYSFQKGTGCPIITTPLLDVGQKITKGDITCLVGADRLTACIDPILNRGFVLQPAGSWTF